MSPRHAWLPRYLIVAVALAVLAADVRVAAAQTWSVRGLFDVGATTLTATDSFDAVLGTARSTVIGGGGEVVLPQRIFANVRTSRFEQDGQRVFVFQGEVFDLGIDTTIRLSQVDVTGGYRFFDLDRRVIPYVGGGLGWHHYEETSEFADPDENVDQTFRGYHIVGGAEVRLGRWFGVGGEVQWTTVPDALGQEPNSVSAAFGETDLGGTSFRVRFVVGR